MSSVNGTGTYTELIASRTSPSTNLATFTTEDNLMKTIPAIMIPGGFWTPENIGRTLTVHAKGLLGTTGAPTFAWTVRLLTTTTWSAAGVAMATASLTAGTSQTLAPWTLDLDIASTACVFGATGLTLRIMGEVRSPLGLASPFAGSIPANNTTNTVTVDQSVNQFIFLSATCGTSSGSNLINIQNLRVAGLN